MNPERKEKGKKGALLATAVVLFFFIGALSATLLSFVASENTMTRTSFQKTFAGYLAEGGGEVAKKMLLNAIANYRTLPTSGTIGIGGHSVDYQVTPVGSQREVQDPDGVKTTYQAYEIETSASYQEVGRVLQQIVDVGVTPIFQYCIFYTPDLEILPGPSMTLLGRVHSNGNIYIGCGHTLSVTSPYLRCAGDIFRMRKNDGSLTEGTVRIQKAGSGILPLMYSHDQLAAMGIDSVSGLDSNFTGADSNHDGDYNDPGDIPPWAVAAMEVWNGSVQTGEHGVHDIVAPNVGSIKRFVEQEGGNYTKDGAGNYVDVGWGNGDYVKGYYHDNADLVIIDNVAYDSNGFTVSLPAGAITEESFYDGRENKYITVTTIDMALLNGSAYFPANGLLYAARSEARPAKPNGIRFKNGSSLLGNLTVASEDPIFIWGNYNTDNKKAAAVITDAINILSNSWNDSKTPGSLPAASTTIMNASFISGSSESIPGTYYCGGFENLPRFHENWTNVPFGMLGSFVNIFNSEIARGPWVYGGDNYTAPLRYWYYDQDLSNPNNLPPFTPITARVTTVAWSQTP